MPIPLTTAVGYFLVSARFLISIGCVHLVRPLARVSSANNVPADTIHLPALSPQKARRIMEEFRRTLSKLL